MLENRKDNSNEQNSETRPFYASAHGSTWVVVADKTRAVIFSQHLKHFHVMHEIKAPDLAVNGPGETGNSAHSTSMQEGRQVEIALAKDIATWLDQQLNSHKFAQLVVVAGPQMLGELRQNFSKKIRDVIIADAAKDLANHNEHDLTQELLKIIPGPDKE